MTAMLSTIIAIAWCISASAIGTWTAVIGFGIALPAGFADRRGTDLDADFAFGKAGRIDLPDRDAVDRIVVLDNHGLHAISFMRFLLGLQCITPAS